MAKSSKKSIKNTTSSKVSAKKSSAKTLTTEDIALEAINMTSQGYSYKEVASSLNVDIAKVYKAVYEYRRKTNVPARSYTKSSSKTSSKSTSKSSTKSTKRSYTKKSNISNLNSIVDTSTSNTTPSTSLFSTIKSILCAPINALINWLK